MIPSTRRGFLVGSVAAAAMLVAGPIAAPARIVETVTWIPVGPLTAWAVGTPGDFDWQCIRANTEAEAIQIWAQENAGECSGDEFDPPLMKGEPCECEYCTALASATADRIKRWDEIEGEPSPADWLRADMGTYCSRCKCETHLDDGARAIGDEAICDDCLTAEERKTIALSNGTWEEDDA